MTAHLSIAPLTAYVGKPTTVTQPVDEDEFADDAAAIGALLDAQ